MTAYGEMVRRERTRQGLSLRTLAKCSGVSAATISRFERGEATTLDNAVAVMATLGMAMLQPKDCKHEYVCRYCGQAETKGGEG